ncbi:hypothetical protein [Mycobacterium heckeshornense]|uniref:hypothetical protein n=1 Tax=Mycobacterium heckeshornense TaxID=110505 RepID=UPI00066204BE|nr:hypothetical protein [Mycobacterium heckeshornense]
MTRPPILNPGLTITELEDLVRLARDAHTFTPDLIADTVVAQIAALVGELCHHRLLEAGMHNPPTCPHCNPPKEQP